MTIYAFGKSLSLYILFCCINKYIGLLGLADELINMGLIILWMQVYIVYMGDRPKEEDSTPSLHLNMLQTVISRFCYAFHTYPHIAAYDRLNIYSWPKLTFLEKQHELVLFNYV